jgi:hypothetical protein
MALEGRLLKGARESGVPVSRLRKLVVFDRLMARLLVVAPDRWILKGGVALEFRLSDRARATKDMDIAHRLDEVGAAADFAAAGSTDLGDYFTFAIERTSKLDVLLEGVAVRYHAVAELAGRTFDEVIVDVGFGNPLVSAAEPLRGHALLAFAEIEPIIVPALPLEQHVAEKVHAYARTYLGGRPSTRVKDLVDLVLIRSHASLWAHRLRASLQLVFSNRGSHTPPLALPQPPPLWGAPYRSMAAAVGIDPDVLEGYRLAAALLDPILDGSVAEDARWVSELGCWQQTS